MFGHIDVMIDPFNEIDGLQQYNRGTYPMRSRTHSTQRLFGGMLAMLAALLLVSPHASYAGMTDYQVTTSTATYTPLTNDTLLIGGSNSTGANGQFNELAIGGPVNIGFEFKFDHVAYTRFSVNPSGLLVLGGDTTSAFNDDLTASPEYPVIAPFWAHAHMYDGGGSGGGCSFTPPIGVSYRVTGTAPNRVLVVQWHTQIVDLGNAYWWSGCGSTMLQFQAHLYERNGRIDFRYGSIWSSSVQQLSASIGIADSTNDFLSMTPSGGTNVTFSTVVNNNNVQTHLTPITANTVYRLIPCQRNIDINGDVAQGGTLVMKSGDSLLTGLQVMRGSSAIRQPFSVSLDQHICATRNFSISLSGPAAGDYQIAPPNGGLNAGDTQNVALTFTPQGIGIRLATLTVTDDNGLSRSYILAARGLTRIAYTGHVAQGGTAGMQSGDTLLRNVSVTRFQSQSFTPFTVSNINNNVSAPGAQVTYFITGVSGAQFSVTPSITTLGAGESSTPTITFSPIDRGYIVDTLHVFADGEHRVFILRAFSISPEARFSIAGQPLDSTVSLFLNRESCVGEGLLTTAIDVESLGNVDLVLNGSSIFRTDTLFGPGIPPFPLLRNAGQPLAATDYILTLAPPVLPLAANTPVNYPIVIPPNTKVTLYLTFIGQYPGKRYARTFINTNAVNLRGAGPNNVLTNGLFKVNLLARANGSDLVTGEDGKLRNAVFFPQTHLDDSSFAIFPLFNPGLCTLRIGLRQLTISQGDEGEFEITRMPDNLIDPVTNDLLIPPGMSDTIVFKFQPRQIGSRRAGFRLRTNDSTLGIPGITEIGYLYVDLYGTGRMDLYASDVDFGTVLIGGGPADHGRQPVRMTNTRFSNLVITRIEIVGDDATEFTMDPGNPWPALPFALISGDEVNLGVVFAPAAGGQPGNRFAQLRLITSNNDTIYAQLRGVAGTRTISVTPTLINFSPVSVGRLSRRTIRVENTGTMGLRLEQPAIISAEFTVTTFARVNLEPGQVEFIEVTYTPTSPGTTSQLFTIESNATDGPIDISLNGAALMPERDHDEDGVAGRGDGVLEDGVGRADNLNVSGVETVDVAGGLTLRQSMPNPGRDIIEIAYVLANGGQVELALYDVRGNLVRTLDAGYRTAGERVIRLDAGDLPSGTYQYRLMSGGRVLARSLVIAK